MEDENSIFDLEERTNVPFTYRFLGLRLRLAFTRRRFERVEASYMQHLTTTALQTARLLEDTGGNAQDGGQGNQQGDAERQELMQLLEMSFTSLRSEIDRIEESQEKMKRRVLPLVQSQLKLHKSFMCFLSGFNRQDDQDNSDSTSSCVIPLLNQGEETTTHIKKLIASFAGVPTGMYVHDLRTMETLLQQNFKGCSDDASTSDVLSETHSLISFIEGSSSSRHRVHVVELDTADLSTEDE